MKLLLKISLLLILSDLFLAQVDSIQNELSVISFNIRFAGGESVDDQNNWSVRKNLIYDIIKKNKPDIIGMQEALIEQINFLDSILSEYFWTGVGRDDGFHKGEFSPIFFHKNKFELIAKGTFWLSDTPYKPSRGWDAAINRICTWVQLKDLNSNQFFYVYNTHFDHIGEKAREESSKLIMKRITEETGDSHVILTGDFNFTSESNGYKILTSSENKKILYDAQFISETESTGGNITFNGFGKLTEQVGKIDFIFVTENIFVLNHSILREKYAGKFPSDHYPVLSKIRFK